MHNFGEIISVMDTYKMYKYRCRGIDDIYQANRHETASTALFHLGTYYEAFIQKVRGQQVSYTHKTAAFLYLDLEFLLNILAMNMLFLTIEPASTIMLREEEISFKLHGLIDNDLDRKKLSHYIQHLYTDAIPMLMICHYCGRE